MAILVPRWLALSHCAFGLWYDLRKSPYKLLDTSAAGPASWNPAIWVLKLPTLLQFLLLEEDFYHRLCRMARRVFLAHFYIPGTIFSQVMTRKS